jgi:hypothetical protein
MPLAFFAFSVSTQLPSKIQPKEKRGRPPSPYLLLRYFSAYFSLPSAVAALRITHAARHSVLHATQAPAETFGKLMPRAP